MACESAELKANDIGYTATPPRYRTPGSRYIMAGCAAGYYACIWPEVPDANTVERINARAV